MTLWTAAEAVDATGGKASGDWTACGVSIDTRTLQPGDLFVALQAVRDGHEFVAQALASGAAAALVSRVPQGVDPARLLLVEDVQGALEMLGVAGRARTSARVLAITGSVGKTSAKEMARTVLERQGRTHAAVASYNNHWGVPLTLARLPRDAEFAVIEIGMNAPGEIAPLARMARPHVAMITTVAAAHLEAFENLAGIASEKADIFQGLVSGGVAIFNGDLADECASRIAAAAQTSAAQATLQFGTSEHCSYRLGAVRLADGKTMAEVEHPDLGAMLFKLNTAGRHFAMNGLGILAAVTALGADPTRAALDLALWEPPEGRGTLEQVVLDSANLGSSLALLDDAFNANPTSMSAALEVLASYTPRDGVGRIVKGRRIAILGDMLELGPQEEALHAGLAKDPSLAEIHTVHCVGRRMSALYQALPESRRGLWFEEADTCARQVHELIDAGDVVLVKGSKGSHVSRVVDALRKLGQAPSPTHPASP